MKRLFPIALLCIVLLSTGCPIGLEVPLGNPGTEKIDKSLIGTWHCAECDDIITVKISKTSEMEYAVSVLEKGEMYSLEETEMQAWVTKVKGESFIYAKPVSEDKYYHYHYEMKGKELEIFDLALLAEGVDAATSTESLIKEVEASMDADDWGKEKKMWKKE